MYAIEFECVLLFTLHCARCASSAPKHSGNLIARPLMGNFFTTFFAHKIEFHKFSAFDSASERNKLIPE